MIALIFISPRIPGRCGVVLSLILVTPSRSLSDDVGEEHWKLAKLFLRSPKKGLTGAPVFEDCRYTDAVCSFRERIDPGLDYPYSYPDGFVTKVVSTFSTFMLLQRGLRNLSLR